ncbi:hypothetical protein [Neisseria sp. P0014.S009]|uniref:hypothetical protein n=1 Tax=unclassified Neisseria TaxID=2623750 RepID=UPI003F80A743
MKQKQHIDLNKVDLTQLDSESMDRLITAFKGTEYYKRHNKIAKFAKFILFGVWGVLIADFILWLLKASFS